MRFCCGICGADLTHLVSKFLKLNRLKIDSWKIYSFTSMTTHRWLDCRNMCWLCVWCWTVGTWRISWCVVAALIRAWIAVPSFDFLLNEIVKERDHPRIFVSVLVAVVVRHVLRLERKKRLIFYRRAHMLIKRLYLSICMYQWNVFLVREDFPDRLVLYLFSQASSPFIHFEWRP